jgi:sugar O-acyltransferase (sialic acid O-acetyltransferase NeuD family)
LMAQNPKNNLVLIGSGGHASVVASLSKTIGLKIKFIAVPFAITGQDALSDVEYLVDDDLMNVRNKQDYILLNGVGQKIRCNLRANIFSKFKSKGFEFQKIVHPSSYVDPSSKVFEGAQVMAGAVIQNDCVIGENSIINTNATIDHGSKIGNSCHVAPGAVVCGDVLMGNNCFIGAGSIVTEGTKLADNMIVKAGQVVNCKGI